MTNIFRHLKAGHSVILILVVLTNGIFNKFSVQIMNEQLYHYVIVIVKLIIYIQSVTLIYFQGDPRHKKVKS